MSEHARNCLAATLGEPCTCGVDEIADLKAESSRLRGLLREIVETMPDDDTWWCPHCGPTDCSYHGRCTKCGTPIEDCQPDRDWLDRAKAELKEVG